jgi:hypothetical protein
MLEELPNELPLKRQIDHVIKVMPRMAPLTKAPYQMNHEELKELKVQFEKFLAKGYMKCCNLSLGLTTKARACKNVGQE